MRRDSKGHEFALRSIACPTCGPVEKRVVGMRGGRYQRWGLGVETPIVECVRCSLVFPDPFPFPLDPIRLYGEPEDYFAAHDLVEKIAGYRVLAREMRRRVRVQAPRLLDIGAGRGDFIFAARMEGFRDYVGIEPTPAIAQYGAEYLGVKLDVMTAEDLALRERPRSFDAIVLLGVLEHVHDPDALIGTVARLSARGAVLHIDVPREPNLLTMVGNTVNRARGNAAVYNLQPTWAPFHVYGFSPRSLGVLLAKHGFAVEEVVVRASPRVRSSRALKDRLQSFVATQVNRVANLTGLASNMRVWARAR